MKSIFCNVIFKFCALCVQRRSLMWEQRATGGWEGRNVSFVFSIYLKTPPRTICLDLSIILILLRVVQLWFQKKQIDDHLERFAIKLQSDVEPLPDSETAAICWSWCGCVAVGKQNIATKTWQQIKCVLKHLYWKQRPSQKINICLNTVVLILSPSSFQYVRQCSENIKIKNKVSGSMKLFYFTSNSI